MKSYYHQVKSCFNIMYNSGVLIEMSHTCLLLKFDFFVLNKEKFITSYINSNHQHQIIAWDIFIEHAKRHDKIFK